MRIAVRRGILAWALCLTFNGSIASIAQEVSPPDVVIIPAGPFISGSTQAEREAAYRLDERAYGHSVTRRQGWYAHEPRRTDQNLAMFAIMRTPVTNAQYGEFVTATRHRRPFVNAQEWAGYGLIHPFERTARHAWQDDSGPAGRADHPVVLVSHGDAESYARWLSAVTGQRWHLPSEQQWEKAARGADGRMFPWGDAYDASKLNSHDAGPFDTVPVASFPEGASPYGVLDMAGQVYEWTSTPGGPGRHIVKGGSWDDKGCGVCRPAARHGRPDELKHILIGFRLVREQPAGLD